MEAPVREGNPLGYEKIGTLLRGFAVPSIIALLVSSLYNVVDQIFIGQGVGYLGNAATNVSFPLTTVCMALTLSIGIGSSAQFSLSLGRGDEEDAARVVGNGFCMMVAFGVGYAALAELLLSRLLWLFGATADVYGYALTYSRITILGMPFLMGMNGLSSLARADGSPTYSMTTMITGAVINLVLDPIFIFVFHWGVAGAAWATVIGQVIAWSAAARYLFRFKRVTLRRSYFRLSPARVGRTFAMGMSNGLTQLAITLLQVVMNRSLGYYGGLSVYGSNIPLAASGVVMKVNSIFFSIVIGFNQGMQPIVGFNYGARRYDRVKATYALVVKCVLVVNLTGLFLFEVFPGQVLSVFGRENELYLSFAKLFMRVFLMLLPLSGVQVISSNFFASIGKPVRGALLSLTRQIFFLIPLMLVLPLFLGLYGVIIAAPVSDLLGFLVVLVFILREMREMSRLPMAEH